MKIFMLGLLMLASHFSVCDLEEGWESIKVFRSYRADVERAFGKPTEGDEVESRYETKDALIRVLYSGGICTGPGSVTGGFKLEQGIVVQYDVVPKGDLRLEDLDWSKELYERHADSHVVNMAGYYNRRDGIRLTTRTMGTSKTEFVSSIYFERTLEQESKFGCTPIKGGSKNSSQNRTDLL